LLAGWAGEFDWRAVERELSRFAHFRALIDGIWIHFIHPGRQVVRGGHFPALEEPQLLAQEIRAFFRPLRGRTAQTAHTGNGSGVDAGMAAP